MAKGKLLRRFDGSGQTEKSENAATVVIALNPASRESLEETREKLQAQLLKMTNLGSDITEESIISLADIEEDLIKLKEYQRELEPTRNESLLSQYSLNEITSLIKKTDATLLATAQKNPAIGLKVAEVRKKRKVVNKLKSRIPGEESGEVRVAMSQDGVKEGKRILSDILEDAVREKIFFNPLSGSPEKNLVELQQKRYAPVQTTPETVGLLEACKKLYQAIGQAMEGLRKQKREATADYLLSEREIEDDAEEIVDLKELLTESGFGRVALLPLFEYDRPIGKIALTKKGRDAINVFAATTPEAAERTFCLKRRDRETGEIETRWIAERIFEISVNNGVPEFDQIRSILHRESFKKEFQRNLGFAQEIQESENLLEEAGENPITRKQLLDGQSGFCPVRLKGWKDKDGKLHYLSFLLEGDGQGRIRCAGATKQTQDAADFLENLVEWTPLHQARDDKRFEAAIAMGEEWENKRRVQEILKNKEIKNLRNTENILALLNGENGDYFLFFLWFDKNRGERNHVNAVVQLKDRVISVKEAIGYFSENLLCLPKNGIELEKLHGPLQIILRNIAYEYLEDKYEMPEFLVHRPSEPRAAAS